MKSNIPIKFSVSVGKSEDEIIGIFSKEGKIEAVFPLGYNVENKKGDILLLIKVLSKYNKKILSNPENNLNAGNEGNEFPFDTALWLLKDYEINGIYKQTKNYYKTDKQGNICWNKTIKNKTPYIKNNKIFYLDFIIKENTIDKNNNVALIQKYIIESCIDLIGFIYPNISTTKSSNLPFTKNTCINILRNELKHTNKDRVKILITKMIEFLNMSDSKKQGRNSFKSLQRKDFSHVWENIIDEIFKTEDNKIYYPNATWVIDNKECKSSYLRPDTIFKKDKKVFVIDSKYYRYGHYKKLNELETEKYADFLPKTSDITKQFIYSEVIKTKLKESYPKDNFEIYDIFMIPFNFKNNEKDKIFEVSCYAYIKDIEALKNKKVYVVLCDTKTMMKQYISKNNIESLRKSFLEVISKHS